MLLRILADEICKYITILMIVLLGIFCGRNSGQSLAPDTFLYPAAGFGLALIVWGSDYNENLRMKFAKPIDKLIPQYYNIVE